MKPRRSTKAKSAKKKRRRANATQPQKNSGCVVLALTGVVVPRGYDIHKNNYGRKLLRSPVAVRANVEKPLVIIEPPRSLVAVPAGSVGKRQATWAGAKAIADGVRVGANVSKLVAAELLSEEQRELIRDANRAHAAKYHQTKRKAKRRLNRAAEDIFRRGVRLHGSFQCRS